SGLAALYYGADAVYLGLKSFSARATAANFSAAELKDFTGYAHTLNRKVYVTVNTLVQEEELANLLKILDICSAAHVDGIIVQDVGVVRIIKERHPELDLHASTQLAVHNKEGALFLKSLGFTRVVLARELSLPEIKEITKIPGLETEVFIHGALCYSYSGQCLFSSLEFGKSANRGKCAYPCRSEFNGKHLFSMKDLALQAEVLNLPATSLKIEGRKKSPLYVAAVTDYYRHLLDEGKSDTLKAENLKQIFSRPWTTLHFLGKNKDVIDRDFVGHRGLLIGTVIEAHREYFKFKPTHEIERYDGLQLDLTGREKPFGFSLEKMKIGEKNVYKANKGNLVEVLLPPKAPFIPKGTSVYLASSTKVKGSYPYQKPRLGIWAENPAVNVSISISKNRFLAEATGISVQKEGPFEKAESPERTKDAVLKSFSKTGDVAFNLGELSFTNTEGLFVPVSLLNEVRRELYSQIVIEQESRTLPEIEAPFIPKEQEEKWLIKTDDFEKISLLDFDEFEEILYVLDAKTDVKELLTLLPKKKVRLSLPPVIRKSSLFHTKVKEALNLGIKKWEISNICHFEFLKTKGIDISLSPFFYTLNSQALQFAKEQGLSRAAYSFEDTLENRVLLAEKSPLPLVNVLYADVPLFISENCIRDDACDTCSHQEKWVDLGTTEALSKDCRTYVFDKRSYSLSSFKKKIPASYFEMDFVYKPYTKEEVKALQKEIRSGNDLKNTFMGNLLRKI
ncbi:MAG: U32 family peptidase, partial [Alphaproteobacteria bacterium]|nr:U32 family peptidase [Alphaproteobacteria bacterium]